MVSQQLIIQCDECSVLFTYQTNRNISRTKSDMEKLYMELWTRVLVGVVSVSLLGWLFSRQITNSTLSGY